MNKGELLQAAIDYLNSVFAGRLTNPSPDAIQAAVTIVVSLK